MRALFSGTMHGWLLALSCFFSVWAGVGLAFPVPICHTLSQVYQFPGVPYHQALRRIHTLDHVGTASGLVLPGFRVENTSAPVVAGDFAVISGECRTFLGGDRRTVRMFTNARHESSVLTLFPSGRLDCMTHLAVFPHETGHILKVSSTSYTDAGASNAFHDRILMPLAFFTAFWDRSQLWRLHESRLDPNVARYQKMVMRGDAVSVD